MHRPVQSVTNSAGPLYKVTLLLQTLLQFLTVSADPLIKSH